MGSSILGGSSSDKCLADLATLRKLWVGGTLGVGGNFDYVVADIERNTKFTFGFQNVLQESH